MGRAEGEALTLADFLQIDGAYHDWIYPVRGAILDVFRFYGMRFP